MDSQQDMAVFAPSGEPDEEAVLAYLKAHPDFFIRNAAQITDMTIPHPVKGAVSLVEWQLGRQRERIGTLTDDLMQLMIQARENEHLFWPYPAHTLKPSVSPASGIATIIWDN